MQSSVSCLNIYKHWTFCDNHRVAEEEANIQRTARLDHTPHCRTPPLQRPAPSFHFLLWNQFRCKHHGIIEIQCFINNSGQNHISCGVFKTYLYMLQEVPCIFLERDDSSLLELSKVILKCKKFKHDTWRSKKGNYAKGRLVALWVKRARSCISGVEDF